MVELMKQKYPRLYRIWSAMKQRCGNPKAKGYSNYGGRGITFCDDWKCFDPFCSWALHNGYSDDLTLERIDVNGNYNPDNCKWIPLTEQTKNTRSNYINKMLTVDGVTKSYAEWAKGVGITPRRLYRRMQRGMSPKTAVTQPCNQRGKQITVNGETHNVTEWSKIKGVGRKVYSDRKRHGLSDEQAIALPKRQGKHHTERKDEEIPSG